MDFFLLDTNLLREGMKLDGSPLFARLLPALESKGLKFGAVGTALRISPFVLLEQLGIVAKQPPFRQFPVGTRNPKELYPEIHDYAYAHFIGLPELQASFVQRKLEEQVKYIHPSTLPLFTQCVTEVLSKVDDPTVLFATFLATDYFLKYPFPKEDFVKMAEVLCVFFFMDLPEFSPASRYRISVRVFQHIDPQLREMPGYEAEARANRLKNREDMLDTDIVQELTFGFPLNGERHRVIALTFDEAEMLLRRTRHHRQVGNRISTKYTEEQMIKIAKPFLDHPGGIIVQASKDGEIIRMIDLAPVFAQLG